MTTFSAEAEVEDLYTKQGRICLELASPGLRRLVPIIERLELQNFKAFARFRLDVRDDGIIVGPNNAGKSTLIAALRTGAYMLRNARRRNPTARLVDRQEDFLGYSFGPTQFGLVEENLRHEFEPNETRMRIRFSGRAALTAVWPAGEEAVGEGGFYYLTAGDRQPRDVRETREAFPHVGIVPMVAPIDQEEAILDDDYVRRNLDGRLASRHFRNQLRLLQSELLDDDQRTSYDDYLALAEEWLPEVELTDLRRS